MIPTYRLPSGTVGCFPLCGSTISSNGTIARSLAASSSVNRCCIRLANLMFISNQGRIGICGCEFCGCPIFGLDITPSPPQCTMDVTGMIQLGNNGSSSTGKSKETTHVGYRESELTKTSVKIKFVRYIYSILWYRSLSYSNGMGSIGHFPMVQSSQRLNGLHVQHH